jgi:hypothetical protein
MDPQLAAIYGTANVDEADLEKLAAAELAEGLANEEEGTEDLTEEDLEAIAQDVLNGSDEGDEGQEKTSEAQEKLAEADYLGRVMAHSYVNELRSIEKTAEDAAPAKAKEPGRVRQAAGKAWGAVKGGGKRYGELMRGGKAGEAGEMAGRRAGNSLKGFKQMRGEALKSLGARGGTAIGAAGAAYGAKKLYDKVKKSSAVDTLVEQRALEILEANGIDPNQLSPVEGQTKMSDPREALANEVEQRAWNLLGQYGVVPDEE